MFRRWLIRAYDFHDGEEYDTRTLVPWWCFTERRARAFADDVELAALNQHDVLIETRLERV